jgi:hypothetical protein
MSLLSYRDVIQCVLAFLPLDDFARASRTQRVWRSAALGMCSRQFAVRCPDNGADYHAMLSSSLAQRHVGAFEIEPMSRSRDIMDANGVFHVSVIEALEEMFTAFAPSGAMSMTDMVEYIRSCGVTGEVAIGDARMADIFRRYASGDALDRLELHGFRAFYRAACDDRIDNVIADLVAHDRKRRFAHRHQRLDALLEQLHGSLGKLTSLHACVQLDLRDIGPVPPVFDLLPRLTSLDITFVRKWNQLADARLTDDAIDRVVGTVARCVNLTTLRIVMLSAVALEPLRRLTRLHTLSIESSESVYGIFPVSQQHLALLHSLEQLTNLNQYDAFEHYHVELVASDAVVAARLRRVPVVYLHSFTAPLLERFGALTALSVSLWEADVDLSVLARLAHLDRLTLIAYPFAEPDTLATLPPLPTCRYLRLRNFAHVTDAVMTTILRRTPSLRELSLKNIDAIRTGAFFSQAASAVPALVTVTIEICDNLSADVVAHLRAIRRLTHFVRRAIGGVVSIAANPENASWERVAAIPHDQLCEVWPRLETWKVEFG